MEELQGKTSATSSPSESITPGRTLFVDWTLSSKISNCAPGTLLLLPKRSFTIQNALLSVNNQTGIHFFNEIMQIVISLFFISSDNETQLPKRGIDTMGLHRLLLGRQEVVATVAN